MADKLCILVCENIRREVVAAVEAGGLPDVMVLAFPAACERATPGWDALAGLVASSAASGSQVVVIGGACCVQLASPPPAMAHWRVQRLAQCFDLFMDRRAVAHYQQARAHLLTPGWLANWRQHVAAWGGGQAAARALIGEAATHLVLLDTGVGDRSELHLQELASYVGLPSTTLPAGLDLLQLFLAKLVLEWRREEEDRRATAALAKANQQAADYAMAFDLIGGMARIMAEPEAIAHTLNLFRTLFAPASLAYLPLVDGQPGEVRAQPSSPLATAAVAVRERLLALREEYAWTPSGTGFVLRIGDQQATLGILEVEGVAFPEYKQSYLNLALTIGRVCGLAIANARAFERTTEAEAALAAERERLAVTLRSIGDGVIATDIAGRVVMLNRVAEKLTGWTQKEAVGKPLDEVFRIVNERTRQPSANPVQVVLEKGTVVGLANHTALIARDGTETSIGDSAAPIYDRAGDVLGVVLVFRDIGEQRRVEEELRRVSWAVEQSPSSVVITNLRGDIEYVNPKFTQLTGYSLAEVRGQNPRLLKSGELPPEEYKRLWEAITAGDEWHGEFHNKKKNGELYWEYASISPIRNGEGEITHFLAVKEDITERKRAEAALRFLAKASNVLASSLDYESTLQAVAWLAVPTLGDACLVDIVQQDGSLSRLGAAHADPAQDDLLRETVRRGVREANPDDPVVQALRTRQTAILDEVPPSLIQTAAQDDQRRAALVGLGLTTALIVPLVAHGRTLGAITFGISESARRYDQEDLALAEELARRAAMAVDNARLYREAQEAIRLRDEFLSVAAHELRTPVTSLRGFAQLVTRQASRGKTVEPATLQRSLQVIDHQSSKLSNLVARLLDLSRIESGRLVLDRKEADVAGLVEEVATNAQTTTTRHAIVVRTPAALPALIDAVRLEQVVTNLIDNAIKYSPEGGEIEVKLEASSVATLQLSVRDHGVGIPPEHREHIFDRFYQVSKGGSGGMGLGLYVSRQIVNMHGGHIAAEFPADGGTRLVVTLPIGLGNQAADRSG